MAGNENWTNARRFPPLSDRTFRGVVLPWFVVAFACSIQLSALAVTVAGVLRTGQGGICDVTTTVAVFDTTVALPSLAVAVFVTEVPFAPLRSSNPTQVVLEPLTKGSFAVEQSTD